MFAKLERLCGNVHWTNYYRLSLYEDPIRLVITSGRHYKENRPWRLGAVGEDSGVLSLGDGSQEDVLTQVEGVRQSGDGRVHHLGGERVAAHAVGHVAGAEVSDELGGSGLTGNDLGLTQVAGHDGDFEHK